MSNPCKDISQSISLVIDREELLDAYSNEHDEDGWIQNARPDKPTKKYLEFPGN